MTHLSVNCVLSKRKMQKEAFKVWLDYSAIKFVVKMHFKDAKEAVQQKTDAIFKVYSPK